MYEKILTAILLVVGVIHVLPAVGLLGTKRLAALYAVSITDANIEILMRHRAVLFGLMGSFFIYSAFNRELQTIAMVAAFISLISFIWLALAIEGYNVRLKKVLAVDLAALLLLLIGAGLCFLDSGTD
jgi:hypothetical protein